jgi:hypothetical protein
MMPIRRLLPIILLAWGLLVSRLSASAFCHAIGRPDRLTVSRGGAKASVTKTVQSIRASALPDNDDKQKKKGVGTSLLATSLQRRWPLLALVPPLLVALVQLATPSTNLLDEYKRLLAVRPLLTKMATGASLAVIGDALAQARSRSNNRSSEEQEVYTYDKFRAVSFAAFDSCYRMFQHVAFPFLVGRCRGRLLASLFNLEGGEVTSRLRHFLAATEQTMVYQLCVVPLIYYPVFFTFTGLVQGLTVQETWQRARTDFVPCWKRNLLFWVPMQFFMFGFLDEKWQIPFSCVMGIVWSTILSAFAGRAQVVTCVADECEIESSTTKNLLRSR